MNAKTRTVVVEYAITFLEATAAALVHTVRLVMAKRTATVASLRTLSHPSFNSHSARIKKIMQADEDVGKIAMAVPLLVSKVFELFLQDLCDRTYEITLKKGAKTMNSFHLKHCIQSFNVFDFLKDVVSRVPDLGTSDTGAESATKRRKGAEEDDHDSDDDIKRNHTSDFFYVFALPVFPIPSEAPSSSTAAPPLPEVKMAIDPIQLANLNRGLDEEEEDYDEEG